VQFFIDKLVKEAMKLKAFNAIQISQNLPKAVNRTLRAELDIKLQRYNFDIKSKIKEVKSYMKKQKRLRELKELKE
jgi:hypothetical protein